VGVIAWPLDGDPGKCLGVVAHPGGVVGMNLSHDGCKLVTAGGDDGCVMVWQVMSYVIISMKIRGVRSADTVILSQ